MYSYHQTGFMLLMKTDDFALKMAFKLTSCEKEQAKMTSQPKR